MSDFIEREPVAIFVEECGCSPKWIAERIRNQEAFPAVDVAPVRHGRWIKPVPGDGENYCSVCKSEQLWFYGYGYLKSNYCPNCGARMDGKAVTISINHPDRIIRKPRFTEQEVEILKHMASAGIVSIKRESIAQISWDAGTMGGVMIVPPRFLPSIQPGQSYTLDEIIGGTNE